MVEERERACDERVLQSGSEREVYAESILKVCKFCATYPIPCVSRVTGADLKKRIVHIMGVSGGQHTSRSGYRLAAADWHSFYSEYFAVVVSVS